MWLVEIIRNDKSLTLYSRVIGESGSRNRGAGGTGGPGRVKRWGPIMTSAVDLGKQGNSISGSAMDLQLDLFVWRFKIQFQSLPLSSVEVILIDIHESLFLFYFFRSIWSF